MKKLFLSLFISFGIILLCPFSSWAGIAALEAVQSSDGYHAGETYPVIFKIRIMDGWYIHGNKPGSGEMIPTSLIFNETPYIKIEGTRFPDPVEKRFEYLTEPVEIFSGEILVDSTIVFGDEVTPGTYTLQGRLSFQACSLNACKPPTELPAELTLTVVSRDTPTRDINTGLFSKPTIIEGKQRENDIFSSEKGLLWSLILIFLGGLALNLSPCIYPMIPVTVSYFGGKSGAIKGHVMIHGLLYLIGLSVTNSLMGVASAMSGSMLGSFLQHPAALIAIALILLLLGLSFFDLWEIRIPAGLNRLASRNFGGYLGTFFMGLTIGIIAAPCIGPFILGLFTYVGQRGDPLFGFLCFFTLSMGMGLPICILAIFSGAVKKLPLSGDWMLWIRRLMGWVLIAMAAYMISPLISGQIAKSALFFAIAASAGIHLGWIDRAGQGSTRFVSFKRISGALIVLLGIVYIYSALSYKEGIRWQPYDEALLSRASQEGMPVILDFYADWCVPCRGLDRTVFRDPEVMKLSEKFITVRMDLTKQRPFQEEVLKRYDVTGVPTIIFMSRNGLEERSLRVESMVETAEFLSAMKKALLIGRLELIN